MESENNGEGQTRQTSLSIHTKNGDFLDLYVYTPYWIINKTALPVQIRVSVLFSRLHVYYISFLLQGKKHCVY